MYNTFQKTVWEWDSASLLLTKKKGELSTYTNAIFLFLVFLGKKSKER